MTARRKVHRHAYAVVAGIVAESASDRALPLPLPTLQLLLLLLLHRLSSDDRRGGLQLPLLVLQRRELLLEQPLLLLQRLQGRAAGKVADRRSTRPRALPSTLSAILILALALTLVVAEVYGLLESRVGRDRRRLRECVSGRGGGEIGRQRLRVAVQRWGKQREEVELKHQRQA